MRLRPLVSATAGVGGGEQPGTRLGESRLGCAQQQKQHQYQTHRQQRDAKTGRIHCPLAESHLSCIATFSHPISTMELPLSKTRRAEMFVLAFKEMIRQAVKLFYPVIS